MNKLICTLTLKHLRNAQGYYTPMQTLHVLVASEFAGMLTMETLRGELQGMKCKGWVDYELDDFGTEKWAITERGRIALKELGM